MFRYSFLALCPIIIFCACFSIFSISPSHAADIVFLKNGDRLTGTILHTNSDGEIIFKMDAGPEIILPADVLTPKLVETKIPETPPAIVATAPAPLRPLSAQSQELAAIEPAAPAELVPFEWGGRVEFGGELQTGNADTESLAVDVRLTAKEGKNRYKGDFEYERSEDEGVITDDNRELRLEYERFQTKHWFIGGDLDFENDDVAELDLRSSLGVKTGYQFFERKDLSLKASGGLAYLNENFANESTDTSLALTQETDYEQAFFEAAMRIFYEHNLLIPTDNTGGFILNAETGIRVPVAKKFIGTAGIDLDYDNEPAEGVKEEDVTYSIKLGYEF